MAELCSTPWYCLHNDLKQEETKEIFFLFHSPWQNQTCFIWQKMSDLSDSVMVWHCAEWWHYTDLYNNIYQQLTQSLVVICFKHRVYITEILSTYCLNLINPCGSRQKAKVQIFADILPLLLWISSSFSPIWF